MWEWGWGVHRTTELLLLSTEDLQGPRVGHYLHATYVHIKAYVQVENGLMGNKGDDLHPLRPPLFVWSVIRIWGLVVREGCLWALLSSGCTRVWNLIIVFFFFLTLSLHMILLCQDVFEGMYSQPICSKG